MVYYDLGHVDLARRLLEKAKQGPLEGAGYDQKQTKIRILISLASIFLDKAIRENVKAQR